MEIFGGVDRALGGALSNLSSNNENVGVFPIGTKILFYQISKSIEDLFNKDNLNSASNRCSLNHYVQESGVLILYKYKYLPLNVADEAKATNKAIKATFMLSQGVLNDKQNIPKYG